MASYNNPRIGQDSELSLKSQNQVFPPFWSPPCKFSRYKVIALHDLFTSVGFGLPNELCGRGFVENFTKKLRTSQLYEQDISINKTKIFLVPMSGMSIFLCQNIIRISFVCHLEVLRLVLMTNPSKLAKILCHTILF